jgi:toxin ParE1/3/4
VKVIWTDEATEQLDTIYAFVSKSSEFYARKIIDKLVSRADDLGDFAFLGKVVKKYNDPNIRELVVSPYSIVYLIQSEHIEVLTVIHGARERPE